MEESNDKFEDYTKNFIQKQYQERMNINHSDFIVHCFSNEYEKIINESPDWYKDLMRKKGFLKPNGKLDVKGVFYLISG